MSEIASEIVIGDLIGQGNESDVYELISFNGEVPCNPAVVKLRNGALCGWQTSRYERMQEYIDALNGYGIRLRESLRLIKMAEGCKVETESVNNNRRKLTIGAVLRLLTKQRGGDVANFVIIEDFDGSPCMTMDDMRDPNVSAALAEILQKGEEMYRDLGLVFDPFGSGAISSAFRCLFDPVSSPVLSNLEQGNDGQIILTDVGLMDVNDRRWFISLSLRLLGEFGLEALNIALRGHGSDIKPRPLGVSNAIPKVVAFLGYNSVSSVRDFCGSKICDVMRGVSLVMG